MPVYLAYDGSVNGDWIARYALRMAARAGEPRLRVLYVEDVSISAPALSGKFANIESVAAALGVAVDIEICPMHHGVFGGLVARLPEGGDTLVVCGLRVHGGRRGIFKGTISEKLLGHRRFEVVAIRVVNPGALGVAQSLLLPIAGDRRGLNAATALVRLLGDDVRVCRLLHVVGIGLLRLRRLDAGDVGKLRHRGLEYIHRIEEKFRAAIADPRFFIDAAVRVSDDWEQEVIIDAGAHKVDLIVIEAPTRRFGGGRIFGDPVERILRDAPCDVAIYRGPD